MRHVIVTDYEATSYLDYWLVYNGRWHWVWRNIWTDEWGCYQYTQYPSHEGALKAWARMLINARRTP